jgi:hypothetical protein
MLLVRSPGTGTIGAAVTGRGFTGAVLDGGTRLLLLIGAPAMLGLLALGLRLTFGTGRNQPGPRIPDPDDPTGDGLLEEAGRVTTQPAAQELRGRLSAAGIRSTLARDGGGYRLLVFRDDLVNAKLVLSQDGPG